MVANADLCYRIWRAVHEYGLPFPRLTEDTDELWLLQEAVMASGHATNQRVAGEHQERESAQAKAREALDRYKASRS